jgi:hypothetical protein
LVPLNATGMVPIGMDFIAAFQNSMPSTPIVNLVNQVFAGILNDNGQMLQDGEYDAWDPLAAAIIDGPNVSDPNPSIGPVSVAALGVTSQGGSSGTPTTVMMTANAAAFRAAFFNVFATGNPSNSSQVVGIT